MNRQSLIYLKKKANQARRELDHGLVRILGIDELMACNVYKQYIWVQSLFDDGECYNILHV